MKIKSIIHLTILALFLTVIIPLSVYAVDGQIKIAQTPSTTFPIVIDKPGSYVLTSNIVVSPSSLYGIEITANDVTLDLNGHAVIFQVNANTGIYRWCGGGQRTIGLQSQNGEKRFLSPRSSQRMIPVALRAPSTMRFPPINHVV